MAIKAGNGLMLHYVGTIEAREARALSRSAAAAWSSGKVLDTLARRAVRDFSDHALPLEIPARWLAVPKHHRELPESRLVIDYLSHSLEYHRTKQ